MADTAVIVINLKLCFSYRTHRACAFTSTAIDAGISVNFILAVAFSDSVNRTRVSTSTTSDAVVGNHSSH